MRSNKEKMSDNLMNWDTEFQVQIENMENMGNIDAAPPGAATQNLVGSVDSISFMDHHASDVSSNKLFPNSTLPPHMNPMRLDLARFNMYQAVSSQPIDPPIHSVMSIAGSKEMKTFQ
jgi:hypothetical protein